MRSFSKVLADLVWANKGIEEWQYCLYWTVEYRYRVELKYRGERDRFLKELNAIT